MPSRAIASKLHAIERARQRAMARRKCHREAKVLTKALLLEGFHAEEVTAAVSEAVTAAEAVIEEAVAVAFDRPDGNGTAATEALRLDDARDAVLGDGYGPRLAAGNRLEGRARRDTASRRQDR